MRTARSSHTSHGTGFARTFAELSSRWAFETSGMDITTAVRVCWPRIIDGQSRAARLHGRATADPKFSKSNPMRCDNIEQVSHSFRSPKASIVALLTTRISADRDAGARGCKQDLA